MESTAIATVVKMMESLPEIAQNQVVEHLREYITNMQDDIRWEILFEKTQSKLIVFAQKARQEIANGLAKPMDYDKL